MEAEPRELDRVAAVPARAVEQVRAGREAEETDETLGLLRAGLGIGERPIRAEVELAEHHRPGALAVVGHGPGSIFSGP